MLSREDAKEQLEQYRANRTGGMARPSGVRRLLGLRPGTADRVEAWVEDLRAPDGELGVELDELDERARSKALRPVAPATHDAIARWWIWARDAPYQQGWSRRGFRSSQPADTRPARLADLRILLRIARAFPQDTAWLAAWSIHLPGIVGAPTAPLAGLFAAEVDAGRDDVADTLTACLFGRHPIGGITGEGIRGLLATRRPECWAPVVTLLRNAGRQEGVRSAVLEAVDLAHPAAFGQVLEAVVADDLTRFAGTVRAIGVWFGEELEVRDGARLAGLLPTLARRLADPSAAVPTHDPVAAYLALWALAFTDARRAIEAARALLRVDDPAVRHAGARLLTELGLPGARSALLPALRDPDDRVFATALSAWPTHIGARDADAAIDDEAMTALRARMTSLGKEVQLESGIVGRRTVPLGRARVADVILANRGDRAGREVLDAASTEGRAYAALRLAERPQQNRAALFGLLTDTSTAVRGTAFRALQTLPSVTGDEAAVLVDSLRRKAGDLRRAAITLLLLQPAADVQAAVDRLAAGTADQRRAAGELAAAADLPTPAGADPPPRTESGRPAGLRYGPADRTPALRPTPPPAGRWRAHHDACRLVVTSLWAWLAEHADVEVESTNGVQLLANVRWLPAATHGEPTPLPEVFGPWWERTEPQLTDGGLEVALLAVTRRRTQHAWAPAAAHEVTGRIPAEPTGAGLAWLVLERIAAARFRPSWIDPLLDVGETLWAQLPVDGLAGYPEVLARRHRPPDQGRPGPFRDDDARSAFVHPARTMPLGDLTPGQVRRLWRLARFLDEPEGTADTLAGPTVTVTAQSSLSLRAGPVEVPDQPFRRRPPMELVARALDRGAATRADALDALIEDETPVPFVIGYGRSGGIAEVTGRRLPPWAESGALQAVVADVRAEAVAGELRRGDLTAPLTRTADRLRSCAGVQGVVGVLTALGKRPLVRGYSWTGSRESSLSHLARIHHPAPGDTAAELTAALDAAGIASKRVVEYGVYAPQWAALVEAHLRWPGYESAVWWVHAHTNDNSWSVDQEIREEWASAVSQRTPLDAVDLTRGAADVMWFADVIAELGVERFETVLAAAKYASSTGGHKRAELYARALLARVAEDEVLTRLRTKRHQDSVRALGLLPLTGRDDPALLTRYETLRGFVGTDRSSGSQRRASESTAVEIGLENLARTAGYRDPQRLVWAMEAQAVRDLRAGPLVAHDGDVSVTLSLRDDGTPYLGVRRGAKELKSVPAKSAKIPEIAALRERMTTLRRQASRMRNSLERSCVGGDAFTEAEARGLLEHPVLAPMLRDLVFVSAEGVLGFGTDDLRTLTGPDGETRALDGSPLRLAHPVDLLASGEWAAFQHALFTARRTQPFRQLFRELYTPTAAETVDGPASRRFAGHQVERRRAAGLFTSRGWVADFEIGFGRTFHAEKITAWVSLLDGYGTAAEVEDAVVQDVTFTPAGRGQPIPVADVAPRLFSEVMRDLDLVVSVAHSGGADPETSESSVEMRRRLAEETGELLGLDNVEFTGHHARIRGRLGSYSVHLGSGQVHRVPGNAVCIIPVSAQHRGRVFLPFADDDPRTAEVVSKILLLARDDRIQDPSILAQLA